MITSIGDIISSIRGQIKATNIDSFITDRHLFSLILKHAAWLIKREDDKGILRKYSNIFQTLDFVEMIDVDKADTGCCCITSDCYIKRSKYKLPATWDGSYGPIIRSVTSIDGTSPLTLTYPSTFIAMQKQKTFKYNKVKYYYLLNDYIYMPNVDWPAIRVEGLFRFGVANYNCREEDKCEHRQHEAFAVPMYLFGEIQTHVIQDLGIQIQIPSDMMTDNLSQVQ